MQYIVKPGDSLWAIAQRLLGNGARYKELGFSGDPKKLPVGTVLNYGGSQPSKSAVPVSSAPSVATAPVETEQQRQDRLIAQWYGMAPKDVGQFNYSPDQENFDRGLAQQQDRPYYQEQVDTSSKNFRDALTSAREGFSRRGMWGAANSVENTVVDPATGLSMVQSTEVPNTGGPVSGARLVAERKVQDSNNTANTAFGRAYNDTVNNDVLGRRDQAENTWQTTIKDPYEEQKKVWMATYPQMK